jgi:type II secretory pathway predicted ATPase ExeA
MIRAWFGIDHDPFSIENVSLLPQQQEVYDTLKVHSHQGGLCLVMGEPGTGKSVIKDAVRQKADKRTIVVSVNRTMHTYSNTLKILCDAFQIDHDGMHVRCERRLIEQAFAFNREGKSIITIIDEAHLLDIDVLRKLRLMFEEFPKNHNLILVGQSNLLSALSLRVNDDIKSRITFSITLHKLNPDDMEFFIFSQLDRAGLGHNTFTQDAVALIVRSSDGILRRCRNLCISCMIEAVRAHAKPIGIEIVNKILIQPHWRTEYDLVTEQTQRKEAA